MNTLKAGDMVRTPDGTLAEFRFYTGAHNKASAVIKVGLDTRVVPSVSLRKVD